MYIYNYVYIYIYIYMSTIYVCIYIYMHVDNNLRGEVLLLLLARFFRSLVPLPLRS